MKATVLESADGRSVILAEDGLFYNTDGNYEVGEIIEYDAAAEKNAGGREFRRARLVRRAAAVAACLVMALFGGLYSYQNLMVYADVTIDGDMPVKCSLNRKGEVIKIEALDDSGEELAEEMKANGIKGKTIKEALSYAGTYIEEKEGEDANIIIVVDCRDKSVKKSMTTELNREFGRKADKGSEGGSPGGSAAGDSGSGSPAQNGSGDQPAGGGSNAGGNTNNNNNNNNNNNDPGAAPSGGNGADDAPKEPAAGGAPDSGNGQGPSGAQGADKPGGAPKDNQEAPKDNPGEPAPQ